MKITCRNGVVWYLGFKTRGLCWFYWLNEADCLVIQIGPFIAEILY